MAQQPNEEKKLDLSSLPRGAIGIKGLPVSRSTRLPSIRSPRDLTLGATPKRTFMPNIPVRREKKPQISEHVERSKQESVRLDKNSPELNDRGRGRGRGQIIQTQSSIFSEGVAADPLARKERMRETYQKSDPGSSKGIWIKKEKEDDVVRVSMKMDQLFRDDFIDDGDDEEEVVFKPTIFPPVAQVKKEATKSETAEPAADFDPNTAKEMNFDVNRVAKLIKKEKGTEVEEEKMVVVPAEITSNEIANLFNKDTNNLVLLQFPEFVNVAHEKDDSESSHKKTVNTDSKVSDNQDSSASIKSLPEGYIGKLQILKSGRARLLVGALEFNLDSINSMEAKHEVVAIKTSSNTGDLTVLGYPKEKITFVPNEDNLLV